MSGETVGGERKTARQQPRHYDLDVWNEGMRLVREGYRITSAFPDMGKFGPTAQMCRAAVSIPSNIAARGGRVEPARFLVIARGSLAELDTQVRSARDPGFTSDVQNLQDDIRLLPARRNALISSNRKSDSKEPR